jgi:hypothetical protein
MAAEQELRARRQWPSTSDDLGEQGCTAACGGGRETLGQVGWEPVGGGPQQQQHHALRGWRQDEELQLLLAACQENRLQQLGKAPFKGGRLQGVGSGGFEPASVGQAILTPYGRLSIATYIQGGKQPKGVFQTAS